MKTPIDDQASSWSHYQGNSMGRTIHYLYCICGLRVAETIIFEGNGSITLGGKSFATVDYSKGFPHFTFIRDNKEFYSKKQEKLLKGEI
jgi:hypothetical protein